MIYKSQSIKAVIANIQNAFNFEGNEWVGKAFDIIPLGMQIIGTSIPLEKTSYTATVTDYRVELPCDLENLLYVTYNGCWLKLKSNSILADKYRCDECSGDPYNFAVLNPNYLQTSFETGEVVFYYEALPLDSEGFPLVPDNAHYIEALGWFLTYKLMTAGFVHKSFRNWREPYEMWERTYPRAQNDALFPSIMDAERLKDFWTSSVRDNSLINRLIH
jgi:hypothetical protein